MEIIAVYMFFTWLIYVSWRWDSKEPIWGKTLIIFWGFVLGWFITPVFIGKAIRRLY